MRDRYAPREWQPHERPKLPGSPSTPIHSAPKRAAYLVVGIMVGLTGGLGTALITANQPYLQGVFGATPLEAAWLPAAYVMTNVSANILLVKFRQQFGLRRFTEIFLGVYALVTLGHLFVHSLASAAAVRAASGIAGAALSTLGLYYVMQAFPVETRRRGLALGISISTFSLPLARIFSVDLLSYGEWRGLYMFELGMALVALAGVLLLKLPPSDRIKAFEPRDFLTFAFFAPGVALLCAVLSVGRIVWWTESAWLGWALAASVALLVVAIALEHFRENPLINIRWMANGTMIRLALSIVLVRIALSEQSVGAVGFLQALGLTNDQMHGLFAIVLAGCVAGTVASALTLDPRHALLPTAVSLGCIAVGALIDAHATNLTRPQNMMLSQFLIGFGSTFFLGPAMVAGLGSVMAQPRNLISFVVMFGMAQNLGGLLGSAVMGTFQTVREKFHSSQLVDHLTLLDPQVAARVQAYASRYAPVIPDPAQRNTLAVRTLGNAETREATVLAYNDVYLVIAAIALMTMAWILVHTMRVRLADSRATQQLPEPTR